MNRRGGGASLTFRSLYDEHRVIWDMLRAPHFLVGRTAVRQLIPSTSFVARNYLSDQQNCKIRMSNVQIIPWYAFYVTPNNAIAYGPRDPILPVDNLQWSFRNYDTIRLRSKSGLAAEDGLDIDEINRQQRLMKMQNEQPVINFIGMNQQPKDVSILNFNDQASDTVMPTNTIDDRNERSALCSLNLDLSIEKNTADNFLEGNVDERNQVDDSYYDRRRTDANFGQRARADRRFRPRRGQLQQNWLDYVTRNYNDVNSYANSPASVNSNPNTPNSQLNEMNPSPRNADDSSFVVQQPLAFDDYNDPNIFQDTSSSNASTNVLQT